MGIFLVNEIKFIVFFLVIQIILPIFAPKKENNEG